MTQAVQVSGESKPIAPVQSEVTEKVTMPFQRLLRAYVLEATYETLRMLRAPAFAIPFLGLPIALYLLFGGLSSAVTSHPDSAKAMLAIFCVFGTIGPAIFGFGVVLAIEREQGLLKLKRALPMPAGAYLGAKMVMAMLFNLIILAMFMPLALTVGHVPLTTNQAVSFVALNILGALPFSAIGLFLATLLSGRGAPGIVNVIYLAMLYLSGLFFPLPKVLEPMEPLWPVYHQFQLVMGSVGLPAKGNLFTHVGVLLTLTLVLTWLAVRRLSRVG